jgi:hypothetical protein
LVSQTQPLLDFHCPCCRCKAVLLLPPLVRRHGLGLTTWSPLASGVLTGALQQCWMSARAALFLDLLLQHATQNTTRYNLCYVTMCAVCATGAC